MLDDKITISEIRWNLLRRWLHSATSHIHFARLSLNTANSENFRVSESLFENDEFRIILGSCQVFRGGLPSYGKLGRISWLGEQNFLLAKLESACSATIQRLTCAWSLIPLRDIGVKPRCDTFAPVRETFVLPARRPWCHHKSRRCSYANLPRIPACILAQLSRHQR